MDRPWCWHAGCCCALTRSGCCYPDREQRPGRGCPYTHSLSSVLRVTHPTVVVRGKRCQIGHFVTAFPARPDPDDDFRDPIEHVSPGPAWGATEQGGHSVQGVAVGGQFPARPAERLDDGLFVVLPVDADPAGGVDSGHVPCLSAAQRAHSAEALWRMRGRSGRRWAQAAPLGRVRPDRCRPKIRELKLPGVTRDVARSPTSPGKLRSPLFA